VFALALCGAALGCAKPAPQAWEEVQLPTRARFNGVWFNDSLNGWIAGGALGTPGGLLGRTRDGGRTWDIRSNVVPAMGADFAFGEIQFRDSLNGCVVGAGGAVMLTSDGGRFWRRVRSGRSSTDAMMDLQMLDGQNGWAMGPATIIGTRDGGETWSGLEYNRSENGYLSGRGFDFVDAYRGWLVSHGAQLMRTDDGGDTWTAVQLPLPSGSRPTLNDITFVDGAHGWLVGEQGTVFHTRDGGETWVPQTNGIPVERVLAQGEKPRPTDIMPGLDDGPAKLDLYTVKFADAERGWAIGWYSDVAEGIILGTRDGGDTWFTERVAPGQYLHALDVVDRTHAWVVGDRERMQPQAIYRYAASE
jgi:photosystem II stability/assembly factor-like uncharacterized protein